jgi:hypothetical protein
MGAGARPPEAGISCKHFTVSKVTYQNLMLNAHFTLQLRILFNCLEHYIINYHNC